ncbi:hypothetical protein FHS35_004781 [Streptomyces umbrinus]|uniref:hypothetical protein n=1 Tax=Streptomyces umbrinus TaxID=67370 RepID=UPI0019AA77A3|nr:hypothetical protein [Streptomyces umbrinus]MCR3727907.1 hypothetical protein [Streptomyces umbrinus]GHH53514.1 hypothetical protein GCM10018775_55430 [Streptomyces umbrinus]
MTMQGAPDPESEQGRVGSEPGRTHVSAAGLRARGWTDGIVRRLLGEPDRLSAHPRFRSAPWTRMYRVERVEAAEQSAEFRSGAAFRSGVAFRSGAAFAARRSGAVRKAAGRRGREAVARRRREVLARILAEPIDVPRMDAGELARRAVEHRAQREREATAGAASTTNALGAPSTPSPPRSPNPLLTDPASLDRWKVDYLRHRLSPYDELLEGLSSREGRGRAAALLRQRILAAIAEAYPGLAAECERQVRDQQLGPPAGEISAHSD